jgi:hypothetical protein
VPYLDTRKYKFGCTSVVVVVVVVTFLSFVLFGWYNQTALQKSPQNTPLDQWHIRSRTKKEGEPSSSAPQTGKGGTSRSVD